MGRFHSYLKSASQLLAGYTGEEPFASFSKKYFSLYKKFGSRDRKWITHLCYCFFRLGKAGTELPVEDRILAGLFLCSRSANDLLAELRPGWNEEVEQTVEWKFQFLKTELSLPRLTIADVFPWANLCSPEIVQWEFILSHFIQPYLFIRVRPGKEELVKGKLLEGGLDFRILPDNCLAVQNTTKIETVIQLDKEAVVQDYSSQKVGGLIKRAGLTAPVKVWDCCAASGGKSILAFDILGEIVLTVSDIRKSILANLKKRFERAGLTSYELFYANLADPGLVIPKSYYDLLIADVPCTGSGTWSRTPEQLYFFEEKKINDFAALQKNICSNIIPSLKPGGKFLYITCSVFRQENEETVEFLEAQCDLRVLETQMITGYREHADTLFAAVFEKNTVSRKER